VKITVIGGGSTCTPELVSGFLARAGSLPLSELCLMDIDAARLAIVGGLAQRMVAAQGNPSRVVLSHDQRAAIEGAAYVIAQLRAGGMAASRADEYLGQRHGLVNDTGETHVVNAPHGGAVPGWPQDWVLELPCRVDRDGIHPPPAEPLPAVCFGLLAQVEAYELLAAEAAVTGSQRAAYQALLAHPPPGLQASIEAVNDGALGLLQVRPQAGAWPWARQRARASSCSKRCRPSLTNGYGAAHARN